MIELDWPPAGSGDGKPATKSLLDARAAIASLCILQRVDPKAIVASKARSGLACVEASAEKPAFTILYLHGGGFRIGGAPLWTGLASRLATAAGARVIVPEYPLAPEHPFPAALDALATLYCKLANDGESGPIILAGDSAGGGLATSLALAAYNYAWPSARALMLFSPWLDLTLDSESFVTCADSDAVFSHAAALEASSAYLAGADRRHPFASPLQSDLGGLPPTWVCTSTTEVLRDDALSLVQMMAKHGKPTFLHVEADQPHVWPIMQPTSEATAATIASAGVFARRFAI